MNFKKTAAIVLTGALIAAQLAAVSADDAVLDGTIDHELGEQAEGEYGIMLIDEEPTEIVEEPTYLTVSGKVAECAITEEGVVESVVLSVDEGQELQLNFSDATVAIGTDGMPVSLAGLEIGREVYAVQSSAQTMSLPPQAAAIAIVLVGEDETAPKYIEVKSIGEVDGKTTIESKDGKYLIAIDEATEFVPYKTRNIVTAADVKEGSKIFAWYGISTKSIPEQALATKIMILPEEEAVVDETATEEPVDEATEEPTEEPAEEKELVITGAEISGVAIDFAKYGTLLPRVENGITYLPVRAIAEATGATVTWDGLTGSITIETANVKAELKIGNDKAFVAGEEVTLAAAPTIIEDRTVVGVSVDLDKYGLKLITEER